MEFPFTEVGQAAKDMGWGQGPGVWCEMPLDSQVQMSVGCWARECGRAGRPRLEVEIWEASYVCV